MVFINLFMKFVHSKGDGAGVGLGWWVEGGSQSGWSSKGWRVLWEGPGESLAKIWRVGTRVKYVNKYLKFSLIT